MIGRGLCRLACRSVRSRADEEEDEQAVQVPVRAGACRGRSPGAGRRSAHHVDLDPDRAVRGVHRARDRSSAPKCAPARSPISRRSTTPAASTAASIELRSIDDGYEPDRAAANTKKLIDDGVFLLFGYVGTPTSNASKPIFTASQRSVRRPVHRRRIAAHAAQPVHLQRPRQLLRRDRQDRRAAGRSGARRRSPSSTRTTRMAQAGLAGVRARRGEAQPGDRRRPPPSSATPSTSPPP